MEGPRAKRVTPTCTSICICTPWSWECVQHTHTTKHTTQHKYNTQPHTTPHTQHHTTPHNNAQHHTTPHPHTAHTHTTHTQHRATPPFCNTRKEYHVEQIFFTGVMTHHPCPQGQVSDGYRWTIPECLIDIVIAITPSFKSICPGFWQMLVDFIPSLIFVGPGSWQVLEFLFWVCPIITEGRKKKK